MLREMLNRNDGVWITRETHYFDDLRIRFRGRERGPLSSEERCRCENYFLALGHLAYGAAADPERSSTDRRELAQEAERLCAGADAYFESFLRLRARANGKTRWGEKTPRHAFRISEMLAAFPAARIVCLIRDPRAVVASYRDWTTRAALAPQRDSAFSTDRRRARRSYHVVLASWMWRGATQASLVARRRYGPERIFLQSYEELLGEPEASTLRLCEWLGLSYQPAMLDVPLVQSSYAPGAQRGISTEPLGRWRRKLSRTEIAVVQTCCRGLMNELGYEPVQIRIPRLRTAAAYVTLPVALVRAGLANRKRMGKAGAYVARRLRFSFERSG